MAGGSSVGERDVVCSSSCCLAMLSKEFRVPTLFGIAHGKVITATLALELSIDSTIPFAPDIMLEMDVREVYELNYLCHKLRRSR